MMRLVSLVARGGLRVSEKIEAKALARARYAVAEEPAGGPGSPRVILMHDYKAGMEAAVTPSAGGELTSLRVRFHVLPVELLYRARDYGPVTGFRGKAPLLWPGTGGCTSPTPCDGFAKDLPWSDAGHSAGPEGARVMLELRDSERTRASYLFGFVVLAAYELADGRFTITYTVSAARGNTAPMPFSIGNRMAFRLPFLDGTEPDDMRFQTHCGTEMLPAGAGASSGEQRARSFATAARLGDFDATTALELAGYRSIPFARLIDPQGLAIRVSHRASTMLPEPVVQFNVRGGPRQGFLCLAPSFGVPNFLNSGEAVVLLRPGADWQWTVELLPELLSS